MMAEPVMAPAPVADDRYTVAVPHGNRTVVLSMLVAFATFAIAGPQGVAKLSKLQAYVGRGADQASGPGQPPTQQTMLPTDGIGSASVGGSVFTAKALFGWLFLFTILVVLADFDSTSDLAGSFALLIMFTTLLTVGPSALENIGKLTAGAS